MINLTQWLCPERHCIIAYVWDTESNTEEQMVAMGENEFKSHAIERVCGICNGEIHVETVPTKYKTIREAMPEIAKLQLGNLKAMIMLQGKSADRIRVRMIKSVRSDLPEVVFPNRSVANPGEEYDAETNRNGAVTIIFPGGEKLGVKPGEFEFIEAPEWLRKIHSAKWN